MQKDNRTATFPLLSLETLLIHGFITITPVLLQAFLTKLLIFKVLP